MWRSILVVILLPALMASQTAENSQRAQAVAEQASTKSPAEQSPTPSSYQRYSRFDGIRRGTSEEVAIELSAHGFVTTPRSPAAGIVPLKLELQPAEGLSISKIDYPRALPRKFDVQPTHIRVAELSPIRFRVRADHTAKLGIYMLRGKLTFQTVRFDSTVEPVQQLDIEIPLTVVEHDAKVTKNRWPFPQTTSSEVVLLIVLAPVLIPLGLIYYGVCAIEGTRNCPD